MVWAYSSYRLIATSLVTLLHSLGFSASLERTTDTRVALWDLTGERSPYPPPPDVPTLALLVDEVQGGPEVLRLHYRGYLGPNEDASDLKRALDAVERGGFWIDGREVESVVAAPPTKISH